MRLSYKCYYFSNTTATWQEAYWKCRDMKSNIATIKNGNQDKIVRKTLDHDSLVPFERWIGGRYDWGTMSWQWAASGREIQFQGFEDGFPKQKEALDWHCIILDPKKHYRWSSRSCTESKHYVCQTKLRKVDNHEKRKLQRQYHNKLNDVPVPDIIPNAILPDTVDTYISPYNDNNTLDNNAAAYGPREYRRKNKKDTNTHTQRDVIAAKRLRNRENRTRKNKRRQHEKDARNEHLGRKKKINYMTYYEATKDSLHPRVAVEDFRYSK
ncbi:uncharacterized protein [Atheta coriaria]